MSVISSRPPSLFFNPFCAGKGGVSLNFGEKLAEGKPDEIRNHPDVIKAYLGESVDI